ncbi:hypothetical protein D3C85_1840660 [compost metagenome]
MYIGRKMRHASRVALNSRVYRIDDSCSRQRITARGVPSSCVRCHTSITRLRLGGKIIVDDDS